MAEHAALTREAAIATAVQHLKPALHSVASAGDGQRLLTQARLEAGAWIVGRAIGSTVPAMRQLGDNKPDCGVLVEDMAPPNGGSAATCT
ncbi:hypothetical protein [Dactylosporangium sp. CA-233914]|uniref:hypothetical protein n=1 Tax=Dactylosporangium sp. CA-233914 TaxID=3239934 RepID=UPI003D900E45